MEERMQSFTGCKVFSATKYVDRNQLGESITKWLAENKQVELVDKTVTQSSDSEFHCLTIALFFNVAGQA